MYKIILPILLLISSINAQAAIVMSNGDTFSAAFTMESAPNAWKVTDYYWEVFVPLFDNDNSPFSVGIAESTATITLYENTDFTQVVASETQDVSMWMADYGLFLGGFDGAFADHDGSISISFNGLATAEAVLDDIIIRNFAGLLAPSNVAVASITPTVSAVPVPAAVWLLGSAIGALGLFSRRAKNN